MAASQTGFFTSGVDTSTLVLIDGTSIPTTDTFRDAACYYGLGTAGLLSAYGGPTPTQVGTLSALADTTGNYSNHNTTAIINLDGGIQDFGAIPTTAARNTMRWVRYIFKTGAVGTVTRHHIGMYSATPMASRDPAVHGFGLMRDTAGGDANWKLWTNDGAGGGTITDTNVAFAVDTRFVVVFDLTDTTSVKCYIGGTLVATNTTNLPTSTTLLGRNAMVRTLEAVAKDFRFGGWDIRTL